ncbi:PD-(D/E)XK nuclease family protein [Patescibacteria group bacterium]|nr:PD-(D/E)XK nuclease family protein [Patescibacteria group bacterium]
MNFLNKIKNKIKQLEQKGQWDKGKETEGQKGQAATSGNIGSGTERIPMQVLPETEKDLEVTKSVLEIYCPYCSSENFVKRGVRKKQKETVQLYLCKDCKRTFTPGAIKGKHYPMPIILDAISLYNLGYSLERAASISSQIDVENRKKLENEKQGQGTKGLAATSGKIGSGTIQPSSLANWLKQYHSLCAYSRMREFGMKLYKPEDVIISATLAHRQLYRFRYHQAKTRLIIEEDFKHRKFGPLKEFLELVPAECPHQYFSSEGERASEKPIFFSKTDMIVRSKQNYAVKLAKFVLESVQEPKQRHDALQRFMLANDSVTVATEVPVYLRREDLKHMQTQLGFEMYRSATDIISPDVEKSQEGTQGLAATSGNVGSGMPKLITGHIDFIQIRNGMIHILDYKSRASKEKPIEQLTLYALALSRLTGLRVFHFKCAWFDEKDYFEFYPLHLVYKPKKNRRKKIQTQEGVYNINQNARKIESLRPITA